MKVKDIDECVEGWKRKGASEGGLAGGRESGHLLSVLKLASGRGWESQKMKTWVCRSAFPEKCPWLL